MIRMQLTHKNKIFFSLLLIAFYLGLKNLFWPMQKPIEVTVLKQDGAIIDLNTPGKTIDKKQFSFDKLSFPKGSELFHQNTGFLGYKESFFLQAKTQINVIQEGNYTFVVNSDDGFKLKLNDQTICQHIAGRAMQSSSCSIHLSKGKQLFDLKYFQGFGNLGLEVTYELESQPAYLIGTDSNYLKFHTVNKS